MKIIVTLMLAMSLFFSYPDALQAQNLCAADGLPMVVIVPSYNNIKWFQLNLASILYQQHSNYRLIYINDCSKDGTGIAVEKYLKAFAQDVRVVEFDDSQCKDIPEATILFSELINQESHFVTLVNNKNRCGALANVYRAVQSCRDDEIAVTVDGDDWLYHDGVLSELDAVYSYGNVWLTHGTLVEWPQNIVAWSTPVPMDIVQQNVFRSYRCPSHLRTFYAWLFKQIKLEDLLYQGSFFPMTWDMAIMYPMVEMAGERHAFISTISYVYNMYNPINDNKVDAQLQRDLDALIRSKPPYQRLEQGLY